MDMDFEDLKEAKLEELNKEKAWLEVCILDFEVSPYDYEKQFDDALHRIPITIEGRPFSSAKILKMIHPKAYANALIEYCNNEVNYTKDEDYNELITELRTTNKKIEMIKDLFEKIEEIEMMEGVEDC